MHLVYIYMFVCVCVYIYMITCLRRGRAESGGVGVAPSDRCLCCIPMADLFWAGVGCAGVCVCVCVCLCLSMCVYICVLSSPWTTYFG